MNKTAVITGASRGIGKAIALSLAKEGYNIVINYNRSQIEAEELLSQIKQNGGNAIICKADVSISVEAEHLIQTAINHFGKIDILVNNAGIAQQKLFTDLTESDWDTMFNVNCKSVFHCSKAAAKNMIHHHSGKIINISSIWGISGASCEVHYSASKAAIIGFTKALAKELGPSNIQVNCVAPGVIHTDMNSQLDEETIAVLKDETPLGVIGICEDIANCVSFLASEKSNFITGQVISPNGGFVI